MLINIMSAEQVSEKTKELSLGLMTIEPVDLREAEFSSDLWQKSGGSKEFSLPREAKPGEFVWVYPSPIKGKAEEIVGGVALAYYDQGRPVEVFVYEKGSLVPAKKVEYQYEHDNNYRHPFSEEPIVATKTIERTWVCGKSGNKKAREGATAWHGIFGPMGGRGFTRKVTFLSQIDYVESDNQTMVPKGKTRFVETSRKVVFAERKHVSYKTYYSGDPAGIVMRSPGESRIRPELVENFTTVLCKPDIIFF